MLFSSGDDTSPFDDAPRILLFTGKGGTGKTTCAAATARGNRLLSRLRRSTARALFRTRVCAA
jgi:AAA+ superfamily predicted ATPase